VFFFRVRAWAAGTAPVLRTLAKIIAAIQELREPVQNKPSVLLGMMKERN
jgi:hypothetical protein